MSPAPPAAAAARLRAALAAASPARGLVVPSCYDALGARMIARAGFPACFVSGFSVSAARLAMPDAGLLSYGEMLDQAGQVAAAAGIPVICDGDTGFGNAQNVQRTVRGMAGAGLACLMLEDQAVPKRDFGAPGEVVPRPEALRRLRAAVHAAEAMRASGGDILVIGRTDARNAAGSASGLAEALWRGAAFAAEGADLVFVTGPQGEAEMAEIRAAAPVPQIVQVDEPGRPPLAPATVHGLGFEVALYGVSLVLAAARAFEAALADMAAGRPLPPERRLDPAAMAEIVGVADYLAVDSALDAEAAASASASNPRRR